MLCLWAKNKVIILLIPNNSSPQDLKPAGKASASSAAGSPTGQDCRNNEALSTEKRIPLGTEERNFSTDCW